MSDKIIENNQVTIMGVVASGFTYSHEVFGEGFYMADVLVKRLSNSNDRIPLMTADRCDAGLYGRGEQGIRAVPFVYPACRTEKPPGAVCVCKRGRIY